MKGPVIGFYNYTVWLTYGNGVAGMVGIVFAARRETLLALICLILAGIFDLFDGPVARSMPNRTEEDRVNGVQLDSLADLISFGVLPAMIGFSVGLNKWYGIVVMAVYVLAALIRLSYFNTQEYLVHMREGRARVDYTGMPVTVAAILFPLLCCFRHPLGSHFFILYLIVLLAAAFAYVGRFRMPKLPLKVMAPVVVAAVVVFLILVICGLFT